MRQPTLIYAKPMTNGAVAEPTFDGAGLLELNPLFAGDRLTRAEFEQRYTAHPEIKKAELIEGIVYLASPVQYKRYSAPHLFLNAWIGIYPYTPGLDAGDNATVRMDEENEP